MDKGEFMNGIHLLQNNYNKKLTTEQLKLYYENLKDMDKDEFINNIMQQIKVNPFMPNVAQIRNKQSNNYSNYEQRYYNDIDFEQFYANKGGNKND